MFHVQNLSLQSNQLIVRICIYKYWRGHFESISIPLHIIETSCITHHHYSWYFPNCLFPIKIIVGRKPEHPGENPTATGQNTQTPHRKAHTSWIWTLSVRGQRAALKVKTLLFCFQGNLPQLLRWPRLSCKRNYRWEIFSILMRVGVDVTLECF